MLNDISPRRILRLAFPGIREDEAFEMIALGRVCEYPAEQVLCHEGVYEYIFYILLDGKVEVTKEMSDRQNRVMKQLKAGDFFGEMGLIHNAPRAATVKAITPVTVLEIHKDDFTKLLERNSVVSLAMVREVSRRLRQNDEMAIEDLRVKASELADAYQALAEMEYARSEFLTTIAHELRTPLTTAGGYLQIIRKGLLQGNALNAALDTVNKSLQEIIALINDILFLQEMEMILPEFEAVHLPPLVEQVIDGLRSKAEQNHIQLHLRVARDIPGIHGNQRGLRRAMQAVLDNAIKFSPDGGTVLVEIGSDKVDTWTRFTDPGVGIPPEALAKIFDRFFHLEEMQGHLFSGVGLGLSIAKQVIEQHKGRIEVRSELGVGSVFTIYLPVPQS